MNLNKVKGGGMGGGSAISGAGSQAAAGSGVSGLPPLSDLDEALGSASIRPKVRENVNKYVDLLDELASHEKSYFLSKLSPGESQFLLGRKEEIENPGSFRDNMAMNVGGGIDIGPSPSEINVEEKEEEWSFGIEEFLFALAVISFAISIVLLL